MFTGLVEAVGRIIFVRRDKICIECKLDDIKLGDSVMVDGVCLTVTQILPKRLVMDIGAETLRKTALSRLRPGSKVNLERAMTLSSRLGGHLVYGHVMEVGKVISRKISGNTRLIRIGVSTDFAKKIISKGSIAINGVSLTVNEVGKNYFSVGIIPETVERTNLDKISSSSLVNLEADMLLVK
jgi:riboflavin synthase